MCIDTAFVDTFIENALLYYVIYSVVPLRYEMLF